MTKELQLPLFHRELFVYRIINRYIKYNDLKICAPTNECLYEAQIIYLDVYRRAIENEVLCDTDMFELMIELGDWDSYDENQLVKVLPKHIEHFQKEIFYNIDSPKQLEQISLYLDKAKQELIRLHNKKNFYNHLTAEGVASFAKIQYILMHSTFDNGKLCDWEKYDIRDVMSYYYTNLIEVNIMRYLARSSPWRDIWYASKKTGSLFNLSSSELSEEQNQLIYWSTLYDNIRESEDCPKENVINYDDALDGWLIVKREKFDKQNNLQDAEQLAGANRNADEIFLVAKNPYDENDTRLTKEQIYGLNDPSSRAIVKHRLDTVEKLGIAQDVDFGDIKTKLRIQQTQMETGR